MINLIQGLDFSIVAFLGILFAFALTCFAIAKLEKFRKSDGSFSFKPSGSSHIMEGAPVAIANMNEGDVNGTTVAIYYTINGLFNCLGVSDIPLLTYKDYRSFVGILNNLIEQ